MRLPGSLDRALELVVDEFLHRLRAIDLDELLDPGIVLAVFARGVIERCDSGSNRAQNVSAIDTGIAEYNKRAEAICKK